MPFMPATVDSPESMCRVFANHVPTIGTPEALQELEFADAADSDAQFTSAWILSSGAKFVILNAQKMVLIFDTSDSFKNVVGSDSEVPEALLSASPPVLYRSLTTASALGCTVMLEPYVDSSAFSLSPTSNTTPNMATLTVADKHTVTAISSLRLNCLLNERKIIRRKNMTTSFRSLEMRRQCVER